MKKLKVNTDGCIGCGACVGLDPEHFDFNDEGLSVVISEENINPDKIKNIIETCPVSVISYEECDEDVTNCQCKGSECNCHGNCDCGDDCTCDHTNCDCDNCDCDEEEAA